MKQISKLDLANEFFVKGLEDSFKEAGFSNDVALGYLDAMRNILRNHIQNLTKTLNQPKGYVIGRVGTKLALLGSGLYGAKKLMKHLGHKIAQKELEKNKKYIKKRSSELSNELFISDIKDSYKQAGFANEFKEGLRGAIKSFIGAKPNANWESLKVLAKEYPGYIIGRVAPKVGLAGAALYSLKLPMEYFGRKGVQKELEKKQKYKK
jgi:predicted NBD/HSP70 family sugar kinase